MDGLLCWSHLLQPVWHADAVGGRPPIIPGLPHHITQRGNRREPVFFAEDDYALYRDLLAERALKAGVEVWAWCLMPNHVHLILVPRSEDGIARAVGETHRRYTAFINARARQTGHLFQGRFSSVVMDEDHLMEAVRYAPRRGKTSIIFAYFFGPYGMPPGAGVAAGYSPGTARAALKCGALNIHRGKWPILGRLDPWTREAWPLPDFHRYELHTRRFLRVQYRDDLAAVPIEAAMPDDGGLPEAILYGAEAAETYLTKNMTGLPALDRLV